MIRHLTARQAAELLGRNVQDVKRLCRTDQLPGAYKTSERGHWRIPETAITAYIAQRQENQPSA